MPSARYERLDPKRRAKIIEAAARELSRAGYENASLNKILAAAKISKSTAYYYFQDKADLCACVLESLWLESFHALDVEGLTTDTFWPVLANSYQRQFVLLAKEPWRWGTLRALREFSLHVKGDERFKGRFDRVEDLLVALVRKGQELGVIRRDLPDALLLSLVMAIDGAGDEWLVANKDHLSRDEVDAISEKLRHAVYLLAAPPA